MDIKRVNIDDLLRLLDERAQRGKESIDGELNRIVGELRDSVAAVKQIEELDSRLLREASSVHVKTMPLRGCWQNPSPFQLQVLASGETHWFEVPLKTGTTHLRFLIAVFEECQSDELGSSRGEP